MGKEWFSNNGSCLLDRYVQLEMNKAACNSTIFNYMDTNKKEREREKREKKREKRREEREKREKRGKETKGEERERDR